MFKPVTEQEASLFDAETRADFAKRESHPSLTEALIRMPRRSRNYLPKVADPELPFLKEAEAD